MAIRVLFLSFFMLVALALCGVSATSAETLPLAVNLQTSPTPAPTATPTPLPPTPTPTPAPTTDANGSRSNSPIFLIFLAIIFGGFALAAIFSTIRVGRRK